MKSFSNDLVDSAKIADLEKEIQDIKKILCVTFFFGLAGFLLACIGLIFTFFTIDHARETHDRLTHLEQTHKE